MVLTCVERANQRFKITHQYNLPDVSSSRIVQGAGIKDWFRKGKRFLANNIPMFREIIKTAVNIANKTPGVINDTVVATSKILGQAEQFGIHTPNGIKNVINKVADVAMNVGDKMERVTNDKRFKQVNKAVDNVLEKTSKVIERERANDPVYNVSANGGAGIVQKKETKKRAPKKKANNEDLLKLIAAMSSKL